MPIVDGRYEAKMSTIFSTVDDGIEEVKRMLRKSRKIRINGIPMDLLNELRPLLENKDLKIILPLGEEPTDDLRQLCEIGSTKAKIYAEYKGKEANTGSISFPKVMFSFTWLGDEIFQVSTLEYGPCVKCMMESFDGIWHYAKKW